MQFKVNYLFLFGIFLGGVSLQSLPSAWGNQLTAKEKVSLVQSASFSIIDGLQIVQKHSAGKAKFAHISRYQDQLVYKIGIVIEEQLKIVLFSPSSGKIIQVSSDEKFWRWKRFFAMEEEEQFLQTQTDLLNAIRRVLDQQNGTVIGAYFKLEDGVHFYRVALWVNQTKQIWIVDSDTEVVFLAKKNHE